MSLITLFHIYVILRQQLQPRTTPAYPFPRLEVFWKSSTQVIKPDSTAEQKQKLYIKIYYACTVLKDLISS